MNTTTAVSITLPTKLLEEVDKKRGLVPRSTYITYHLKLIESNDRK